jgi:hypothetical protein
MVAKQVQAVEQAPAIQSSTPQEPVSNNTPHAGERNLFVRVDTFDVKTTPGTEQQIGTRIVDMYHFGTRNWLANHQWWAMHNGHLVEIKTATTEQIAEYVASQKAALAAKFNHERSHTADAPLAHVAA